MIIELRTVETNPRNGAAYAPNETVIAGNGNRVANGHPEATENDDLLSVQVNTVYKIKQELNDIICCGLKLWMIIILLFVVITAVIFISLGLCTVIHEDEDEKFDPSSFKNPLCFNGTFQMPNMVFTEELDALSSNESQTITADLQEKLDDLYRSSTALGRYFSKADILAFRNGSVVVEYELTFLLPEAEQQQLRRFVISRELVYNVLRQFLHDQETDESEASYINPASLTMIS